VAFTTAGALTGAGALAGASSVAFATTGTLAGEAALSAAVSVSFTASGGLSGDGALSGSSTVAVATSGILTGSSSGHDLEARGFDVGVMGFGAPGVQSISAPAHGGGGGGGSARRSSGSGLWVKVADEADRKRWATVDLAARPVATAAVAMEAPALAIAKPVVLDLAARSTATAKVTAGTPSLMQIHQLRPRIKKRDDIDKIMHILAMIDTIKRTG
jgi:hypothetical protein